jgi:3'-phosphoadenosine 5'-phosphosulfate sulfotransferase (PAPS reductase)/FAD synthetase
VRVRWLEWATRRVRDDDGEALPFDQRFAEVGYNSASRNGEPFAQLIAAKGYTPNAVTRFCTSELKVRVMKHFMQAQGYSHWTNVVGLRADEPRRVARASEPNKERWTTYLPLALAGVSERDVLAFWKAQDFDLQLRSYEGNCDMCFLKSFGKLCQIEAERPGSADWWKQQEVVGKGRFVTEYSYAELQDTVQRQGRLFDWAAVDSTEREHDAECGAWCAAA